MNAPDSNSTPLNLYREVSSNISLGIFLFSASGDIIWANKAMLAILGSNNEEIISEHYQSKVEKLFTSVDFINEYLTLRKKSKLPLLRRATIRTLQGDHHPVTVNIEKLPVKLAEYYAAYVAIVPPASLGQDCLEGIGLQLRSFYEEQNDFYYLKNRDGDILTANKLFLDFFNVKNPAAVTEKSLKKQSPPTILKILQEDDEFITETGKKNIQALSLYSRSCFTDNFYVRRVILPGIDDASSFFLVAGHEFFDFSTVETNIIDSQANLHNLIESSESSIWLVDANLKIIRLNSQFRKFMSLFFNRDIQEGDSAVDCFPKTYASLWKKAYNDALKGESSQGQIELKEDFPSSYFEYNVKPVLNNQYRVEGISIFLTDISFRKHAEDAIRESEEQFRQLAENTRDALILSNKEGIIYVNPAFEELFSISAETAYNNKNIIEERLTPQDRKEYKEAKKALYKNKNIDPGNNYQIINESGEKIRIWMRTNPIFNAKNQFYRELVVISNLTDQYELENAVSRSRVQQKAILDNIPYLAWLKDKDGKYISANEPFAKFFDLALDDIIGRHDEDIFDNKISTLLTKYDTSVRVAQNRKYFEDEWVVNGNPCWVETFASPIFGDADKLIGITGIARDITDRKTMEDTIIRNEEHFRALLQYSSDTISILDKSGTLMFESALRNRITDFLIDETIGKSFEEIIHPEDVHIFREIMSSLLSNPAGQIKREYRCLHKNKKWIYVESIFSNHINNPSIRGIVVNSRDISDRKMSELKERVYHDNLVFLSNSALELLGLSSKGDIFRYIGKKLFSYLEDAIVVVSSYQDKDVSFVIETLNATNENTNRVHEVYEGDIVGQKYVIKDLTKSISNAGNIGIFKGSVDDLGFNSYLLDKLKKIKKEMSVSKVYYISMSRDNKLLGNILILTLNNTIIKYKHIIETFVHQVSVALQRSQLESELIEAKEKAEESDKLKTAFLANMSHEIRTPMNGILGFAEMLNDDHLAEGNRKKYVEIINNNGKMLMNLIDDVIDFAKIEAGEIKILKQEFSLNSLLTQIHSSFLSESLKKERSKVKLRVKKAFNDDGCYLQSDPNRLRQILMNLVGNAFKFTKEGYIEFGYELPKEDEIQFFVKDTGIGIPEEKLDLIFERFVQGDYSRSRKYSGSGLGLAISKGFVELLGGTMWATSKVKEGSTFYFKIPYSPASKKSKEETDKKKPRTDYDWKGKTFLVAEDDTFSYKLLEGFLKKTNANILHAEDGVVAVELCKQKPEIDLVLMDVQMPEMNGMEATKIIKDMRQKLPVIAQTANAIAEERQRCFEAGCDDFVTKPINITELFLKIDQWLSSK